MRRKVNPIENVSHITSMRGLMSSKPSTSSEATFRSRRVAASKPSRFYRQFGDKKLPRRLEDMQAPNMLRRRSSRKLRSDDRGQKKFNKPHILKHLDFKTEERQLPSTSRDDLNESLNHNFMEKFHQSDSKASKDITSKHIIGQREVRKECIFKKEKRTFYIKVHSSNIKGQQPNERIQKIQYSPERHVRLLEESKNYKNVQNSEENDHPGFVVLENSLKKDNIRDNVKARQQQKHHEYTYQFPFNNQMASPAQCEVMDLDMGRKVRKNREKTNFKNCVSNVIETSHTREKPSNQNVYGIKTPDAQSRSSQRRQYLIGVNSSVVHQPMKSPNSLRQTAPQLSGGRETIIAPRDSDIQHADPTIQVMFPVLTYVPQIIYAPYSEMINYTFPTSENYTSFPDYQTNILNNQNQNSILHSSQSYIYAENNAGANLNGPCTSNNQNMLQHNTYMQESAYPLPEIPSVYCGVPLSIGSSYETPGVVPLVSNNDISSSPSSSSSSVVSHTSSASLETSNFPGCSLTKSSQVCITTSQINKNTISNIGSVPIGQGLDPLNTPHALTQTPYPTNIPEKICDTGESMSGRVSNFSGALLNSFCELQPSGHIATAFTPDFSSKVNSNNLIPRTKGSNSKISQDAQTLTENIVLGTETKIRYGQVPNIQIQNDNCKYASQQIPNKTDSTNSNSLSLYTDNVLLNPVTNPEISLVAENTSKLPEFSVAFSSHLPHEGNLHIKQYKEFQLYNSQKKSQEEISSLKKSVPEFGTLSYIQMDESIESNKICHDKTITSEIKQIGDVNWNLSAVDSHLTSNIHSKSFISANSDALPKEKKCFNTITCDMSVQTENYKKNDSIKEVSKNSILKQNNPVENCVNVSEDLIPGHNKIGATDLVLLKPRDIRECLGTDDSLDISEPFDSLDKVKSDTDDANILDLSSNSMYEYHNAQEKYEETSDHNQSLSKLSSIEAPIEGHVFEKQAMNLSIDFRMNEEPVDLTIYCNEPLNMSIKKNESNKIIDKTNDLNDIKTHINADIENNELVGQKTSNTDIENEGIVGPTRKTNTVENLSSTTSRVNDLVENPKSIYKNSSIVGVLNLSLNDIKPLDMTFKIKKADDAKQSLDIKDEIKDASKRVKFIYKSMIKKEKSLPNNSEFSDINGLVKICHESFPINDQEKFVKVKSNFTEGFCFPRERNLEVVSSEMKVKLNSSETYEASNDSNEKDLHKAVNNGTTKVNDSTIFFINEKLVLSSEMNDKSYLDKDQDLDKKLTEIISSNNGCDLNTSIIFEKFVSKDKSLDTDTRNILEDSDALSESPVFNRRNCDALSESPVFNRRNFVPRRLNITYLKSPKEEKPDDYEDDCKLLGSTDCNDNSHAGNGDEIITKLDVRILSPKPSKSPELTTFRPQDINTTKDKLTSVLAFSNENKTLFDNVEVKQEALEEELNFTAQDDSGFYTVSTPEYESEQYKQTKHQLLFKDYSLVDQQKNQDNNLKQHKLNEIEAIIHTKQKKLLEHNNSEPETSDNIESENVLVESENVLIESENMSKQLQRNDHVTFKITEKLQGKNDLKEAINNTKTKGYRDNNSSEPETNDDLETESIPNQQHESSDHTPFQLVEKMQGKSYSKEAINNNKKKDQHEHTYLDSENEMLYEQVHKSIDHATFKLSEETKDKNYLKEANNYIKKKKQFEHNSFESKTLDELELENISKQQDTINDHATFKLAEKMQGKDDVKELLHYKMCDFKYLKNVDQGEPENQHVIQDKNIELNDSMLCKQQEHISVNKSVEEINQNETCELDSWIQINKQKSNIGNENYEEHNIQNESCKIFSLKSIHKHNLSYYEKNTLEEGNLQIYLSDHTSLVEASKQYNNFRIVAFEEVGKQCETFECDPMVKTTVQQCESLSQTEGCETENIQHTKQESCNFNDTSNQHYEQQVYGGLWSPGHKAISSDSTTKSPSEESNKPKCHNESFVPDTPQMKQEKKGEINSSCIESSPTCNAEDHALNLEQLISPVIPLQYRSLKGPVSTEENRSRIAHQILDSPNSSDVWNTVNDIFIKKANNMSTNIFKKFNEDVTTCLSREDILLQSEPNASQYLSSASGDPMLLFTDPEPATPSVSLSLNQIPSVSLVLSDLVIPETVTATAASISPSCLSVSVSNDSVSSHLTNSGVIDKQIYETVDPEFQTNPTMDSYDIRTVDLKDRILRSGKHLQKQGKDFGLNVSSQKRKENIVKNSEDCNLLNKHCSDIDNKELSKVPLEVNSITFENMESNKSVLG
ncbi:unnamed protein product, partial [Meganyctiphanes norvegica]